jgi:hypothetical protein
MSVNDFKPGAKVYKYEIEISNGNTAQITVHSSNDIEKQTYLKHFLEKRDSDTYFVDDLTGTLYNKEQIISVKEKVVKNG